MRADLDNLRAALNWCLSTPGQARTGLRLAAALGFLWTACGGLLEGRYWLERALAADPEPTVARAAALSAYTRILITQADHSGSAASAAEGRDTARGLGDPRSIIRAAQDFGVYLLLSADDLPRAQAQLEAALTEAGGADHGDLAGLAMTQLALAMAILYQGDPERAERLCAECDAFCRAHGDRWWRANVLSGSALVAMTAGEPARAARYLRQSLSMHTELGNTVGTARAMELLSRVVAARDDPERAAQLIGIFHRFKRELGHYGQGPMGYWELGRDTFTQIRRQLGARAFDAAYRRGRELPTPDAVAYALGAPIPPAAPPDTDPGAALTSREREVAKLVRDGLSNREIASHLTISQRTAESHVQNILRKLGLTSRTQMAAWIATGRDPRRDR
jgi:non-specific serine/threonine protein kinase